MKNSIFSFLKAGLIISGAILLCLGVVWLMDSGFNGVFKEWFYHYFDVDALAPGKEKLGIIFSNWYYIKQFFVVVFFSLIAVLILCAFISANLYSRHRSKKDMELISRTIGSMADSETEAAELPQKYSEIEKQLARVNSISQKRQQLAQSEMQRKNDLITYLAHDLKTPLASVIGYLSLLDEARDMPSEQKQKYVEVALKKAYRLEELINEFFDITRFNLQSIVLNTGKIKLAFMLQQMADEFYPILAPQGKKAEIHVPDDLILTGDADKLARVFNNILKNAAAYSYENSVIDISAGLQDGSVIITFENRGDPIPAQKLETIFEKFYRLDSARSTDNGGAGLGLAIAKEIVVAHGGMITVDSSAEHTAFTVKLPH